MNTDRNTPQRRPSLRFRKSFRSRKTKQQMADRTCSELALEGERLCREGEWEEGIRRLEAATRTGTSDLKTLSALYSQLGNAYFYLENYSKALENHRQDLTIARTMGDKLGEAKACGNIGSALKTMGQFDEAIACCRMQLDLARGLRDKVLESRALYNLGNVYHARGKHASMCNTGGSQQEVEDFVRASLEQAARHYEANLKIVRELGDQQAQGRTVGNLGNTHYLLGNYKKAIKYHEERLSIADALCDLPARRRAYSNLGNAHVFIGKYSSAAHYYLNALEVSKELNDSAFEAQSCYSLGNTYTLMGNHHKAIEYHLHHLQFAILLEDRIGEARAYWSLGNAYTALGDHKQAMHYAGKHFQVAVELGDEEGITTAKQNLSDLNSVMEFSDKYECPSPSPKASLAGFTSLASGGGSTRSKRKAKDHAKPNLRLDLSKAQSPDAQSDSLGSVGSRSPDSLSSSPFMQSQSHRDDNFTTDDGFFEMISKFQSRRMDDQRTSLPASLKGNKLYSSINNEEDDLIDVLCRMQGSRIEDQRCDMAIAPHIMPADPRSEVEAERLTPDELFDLIFRSQSGRINDQRCARPDPTAAPAAAYRKSTMPSEDFFNLIQHLQSTRIEDQRSPLPVLAS